MSNTFLATSLVCPIDGTAALPPISFGTPQSGTGIYGTFGQMNLAINGVSVATITSAGITGTIVGQTIATYTSSAGAGGAATEAMVLTGLLATDTILAVTQKTKGGNNLPLLGYSTLANNALTAIWSADPGVGSVIVVTVKR